MYHLQNVMLSTKKIVRKTTATKVWINKDWKKEKEKRNRTALFSVTNLFWFSFYLRKNLLIINVKNSVHFFILIFISFYFFLLLPFSNIWKTALLAFKSLNLLVKQCWRHAQYPTSIMLADSAADSVSTAIKMILLILICRLFLISTVFVSFYKTHQVYDCYISFLFLLPLTNEHMNYNCYSCRLQLTVLNAGTSWHSMICSGLISKQFKN